VVGMDRYGTLALDNFKGKTNPIIAISSTNEIIQIINATPKIILRYKIINMFVCAMIKGQKELTKKIDGNAARPQSAPPRIENEITAKSSKNLKIISSPNFWWF
tara:strand:- start:2996 stop:3307 length:312 start_codon:yes stop_codon:yes gene_type:complete